MKWTGILALAICLIPLALVPTGCTLTPGGPKQTLAIKWQRLVDEPGKTCQRCSDTQREVRLAVDTLARSLRPLDIRVVVEEVPMSPETVARDTSQSNRIFLDDRPLANWLGGAIGTSPCKSCCPLLGPGVKCRTLTVDGKTYEAIPAALIIRAGLRAADAALARRPVTKPCCANPGCAKPCDKPHA